MTLPTPPRAPDTVPVLNSTPYLAFTRAWQLRPPRDALIAIVKGTFDLRPGERAQASDEQDLPTGELPFDDGAPSSLRYPGDIAYFKPRADVFLVGHAYPRDGATAARVRFQFGRQLDVAIAAVGPRSWVRGAPSAPGRLERVALRAENAYGGPGFDPNPLGVGYRGADGSPLPTLERADALLRSPRDAVNPVLTTPLSSSAKSRAKYAGTYDARWAKSRAPYFPDDFDYRYFNMAPEELQVAYPKGNESYVISGLHPERPSIEGRLPNVQVHVFAQTNEAPDTLREVPVNLDTVWFDADAMKLVLVWRGATEVRDMVASELASLFVYANDVGAALDPALVRQAFREAYEAQYGEAPEPPSIERSASQSGIDDTAVAERPPGPHGLTPSAARALGLPAWAASEPEHEALIEAAPPEPPSPAAAVARGELEAMLASGRALEGADLSHCDFRGLDLRGQVLRGANMSHADLRETNCEGADLSGALLSGVHAAAANFRRADLSGADLGGAILTGADFSEANLTSAVLTRAVAADVNFERACLRESDATDADLQRARFLGAELGAADLSGCLLDDAVMRGATMPDVRMYDARAPRLDLEGAVMPRARLDGAVLVRASLQRVAADGASVRGVDLSDADLRHASLRESVFEDAVLDRAMLSQVDARDARFPRAQARKASLLKANLMRGHFEGANFEGADLRGSNLFEANTFRASFVGANLTHAILKNSGLE